MEPLMQDEGASINTPLWSLIHLANFSRAFTLRWNTEMRDGRRGHGPGVPWRRARSTDTCIQEVDPPLPVSRVCYFAKSFPKGRFQIVSSQTFF